MENRVFLSAQDQFRQAILWSFVYLEVLMEVFYGDTRHY